MPEESSWTAVLADRVSGERVTVEARGVVNAGGTGAKHGVRPVKGSHIVVRKLFDHAHPYIFQGGDGRVLFAIPYEEDYTLLGTTDVEFEGAPGRVEIAPEEVDYICTAANAYFATPVAPADVVWSYAGIRPLFDDLAENASEVTRDYALHLDRARAPMLSVYGGKLTTLPQACRAGVGHAGGASRCQGIEMDRHYGTGIHALLAGRGSVDDLGEHFGAGLYAAEVAYLVEHEWARSAEDILWRPSRPIRPGVLDPGGCR